MAYTEMSLPIDIPWKRMGVSKDMIDPKAGDLTFPEKWRSSIAVFYHEPPEVPPEYCNRKITYLKIVCTIANYQWGADYETGETVDDVTVLNLLRELPKKYGDFYAWRAFSANVTQSFPCYGALLQVAVFPNAAEGVALHDFPYVSSFQPRKREMFEAVTESGEVASQSGNKINVLKGGTITDTNEKYDLDLGGGSGGHSGAFGLWSEQHSDPKKQKGSIDRYQDQYQNIRTTDTSRDKRETHAYSTNLNQLYSLLQGYHLGTNRALFFLQPRPHIQDTKFTFVRGPRRLEGIQEFFLIVNRPASVPGICVEAALETAHLAVKRAYKPRIIRYQDLFLPGNLQKTARALGLDENDPAYAYEKAVVENWNSYSAAWRWAAQQYFNHNISYNEISSWPGFNGVHFAMLVAVIQRLSDIGHEDLVLIFEEYESDAGWFFVTGRRLCSCVTPFPADLEEGEVNCERSAEAHISTCDEAPSIVISAPYDGSIPESAMSKGGDSNLRIQNINGALWSSLGSSERAPYGKVSFLETEFVLAEMSQLIRLLRNGGIQGQSLAEIDTIRPLVKRGLGRVSGIQNILELGTLSTNDIARDLEVTKAEARKYRRELLIKALGALDAKTLNPDIAQVNPIQERFTFDFPIDKLRDIERSARIFVGEPKVLKKSSALSRLIREFVRFFYVRD